MKKNSCVLYEQNRTNINFDQNDKIIIGDVKIKKTLDIFRNVKNCKIKQVTWQQRERVYQTDIRKFISNLQAAIDPGNANKIS